MRLITTSLLALGFCLGAQAQDTSRDAELVKSVTKADMRYMIEASGYKATSELTTDIGWIAEDEDGVIFALQGKACGDDDVCLGLEAFLVLDGDFTSDEANSINQRWSAIKATKLDGGGLYMSRYMILDHGQTLQNLRLSLETTYAIAKQVMDEKKQVVEEQVKLTTAEIEWGDDAGEYANDQACDDARFHEDGDDWNYQREHVLHDATDCRSLYDEGSITLFVDFGNNSGEYADDDTCDDNRFTGEGRSILTTDSHVRRDSADCIAAYQQGRLNRP